MKRNIEDLSLIESRKDKVSHLKKENYSTYVGFIKDKCGGARVIDFGFANHSENTTNLYEVSSHQTIAEIASQVLAIDIVDYSGKRFENCKYYMGNILGIEKEGKQGGAQVLKDLLGEENLTFDVFFAGNVIEHLSNPGQLFETAMLLLRENGKLVITTVNPLWFIGLWDRATLNYQSNCIDHVSLIGPQELIEFAERYEFTVESWSYIGISNMVSKFQPGGRVKGRLTGLLYNFLRKRSLAPAFNIVGVVMVKQ
jgi:SAM-dependent methyltransferase